jgi:TctA family transporter
VNITPPVTDDEQHLRLLSIFHYAVGGLTGLFACFPLIHVALGLAMVFAPQFLSNRPGDQPPAFFGWFFTCVGGSFFLAGISVAICIVLAGRFIAQRKRYWFIFALACVQCASCRSAPRSVFSL